MELNLSLVAYWRYFLLLSPGDLESFRRYATERGYDWENDTVDINSYYTSYAQSENTEIAQGNPATPSRAPWVEFAQVQEASSSEEEQMTPRNPEGRFITMKRQQATTPAVRGTGTRGRGRVTRSQVTPSRPASSSTGRNRRQAIVVEDQERPYLLQGAVGNMVWKEGESEANAASVPILRRKLPLQVGDKSYNRTTRHPVKSRLCHLETQKESPACRDSRRISEPLKGAQGNSVWKEGEIVQNAVGITNVAKAAVNTLRHLVNAEGALDEEDFQQIKEFVEFINEDDMQKHLQELLPQQHSTPQGRLTSAFLQDSTERSVQRRLFNLTPTPNQRKKPRLLEELEAESDSAPEDSHQISKAKAREQSKLPYIIRNEWDVDGERIVVYVLYAAGQALPVHDGEVAGLLGKFHESVITETNTNFSLSSSMALLGIPASLVLRTDPSVICLAGEGAEKSLSSVMRCAQHQNRSAVKNLARAAVQFYNDFAAK
ncbi:hypothetical protein CFAM422_007614 [Trichoderma lentiforme]|uniref:Uncharacterized protein n=1 Tax=Trichoderma lentiforme TaxID=1567552 RepID=A0A9P5CAT1_9HYPO|nr:hypothetical protein CFAM422_007614 [Trichoderma lentiforme]